MDVPKNVTISIDNTNVIVPQGKTILQASLENNVYIPTLCYHKELSPHGGCRLCIVEIEGVRGFPTSCTTPVEDGMIIRTQTAQIQALRKDILQLFLSEHTSSCLLCDEKVECKQYMPTIRKAGVTTGCRYCPKDGQCELQAVTEWMDVKEINYPISYRNLPVETEDPFYDRDYNLCILCGRCVRMCQEIRTANVLTFKYQGHKTVIGPAFGRTHLEAGCEFCGACVAVCPTGTLREKTRAWEGKPEQEVISTCSFCGVGCQLRLLVKGGRVIGSLPADDPIVNNGQLCVKGRFCNTELVNGYQRLKNPHRSYLGSMVEITWQEAIALAAEKLSACPPDKFGMLVSPHCTNEDLYVAQKFVRVAMNSNHIDTSARWFYGDGLHAYLDLMRMSVPLSSLNRASVILCIGLDTRFGRSVVGVALRKAVKNGTKVVSINSKDHNLSLIADHWLRPEPGEESSLIDSLTAAMRTKGDLKNKSDTLAGVAEMLKGADSPVFLVGSEFMQYENCREILEAIKSLAQLVGAGVMPLPIHNNFFGSVLIGAYPEFIPGGFSLTDGASLEELKNMWQIQSPDFTSSWNAQALLAQKNLKVLYLLGELPPTGERLAEFTVSQNIYPPEPFYHADLSLPAAAPTEIDGTYYNGEGRLQRVRKAVDPPGNAIPDWKILSRIAQKMGKQGFDYNEVSDIWAEMHETKMSFSVQEEDLRKPIRLNGTSVEGQHSAAQHTVPARSERFPLLLTVSAVEHTYRGFSLSTWVEGSRMLLTEGMLEINPEDARKLSISNGDIIEVSSESITKSFPAKILEQQTPGILHVSLREAVMIHPNPQPAQIRKTHV
jgi:formate dehydrogenase alpha subunit